MAKKSKGLQYEEYTADDAKKDKEELRGGGAYERIQAGKNVYRILPAAPGGKWKRTIYRHFLDIPGAGTVSFTCPRMETKGKRKCTTCEKGKKLLSTGNEIDERLGKRMLPQTKVLCNVINRKNEDAGPRTLEFGAGIGRDLAEMRDLEEVDFTNPINGSDIAIIKSGQGRVGTRYKVKEGDRCPLHEDTAVMQDWIDNQPDLEAHVKVLSDEAIADLIAGEGGDDRRRGRDDDDDEPAPRRRSRVRDDDDEEIDVTADTKVDDEDDEEEIEF